jgi:hypothetical protein
VNAPCHCAQFCARAAFLADLAFFFATLAAQWPTAGFFWRLWSGCEARPVFHEPKQLRKAVHGSPTAPCRLRFQRNAVRP